MIRKLGRPNDFNVPIWWPSLKLLMRRIERIERIGTSPPARDLLGLHQLQQLQAMRVNALTWVAACEASMSAWSFRRASDILETTADALGTS